MQEIFSTRPGAQPKRIIFPGIQSVPISPAEVFLEECVLRLHTFGFIKLPDDFTNQSAGAFFSEINIVLEGTGDIWYDGVKHSMKPGFAYLFPRGKTVRASNHSNLTKFFVHVSFLHSGIDILQGGKPLSFSIAAPILESWKKTFRHPDLLGAKAIAFQILNLFRPAFSLEILGKQQIMHRFESFFEAARNPWEADLDQVASRFGKTKKRFAISFKKAFGMTPKQYLLHQRIAQIQDALKNTDDTLSVICDRFKISGEFYLSRFFKKMTGSSPREFRQQARSAL